MGNNMIITRYIPYEKFVDICANGLFLPNVSLFEDIWEGLPAIVALLGGNLEQEIREKAEVAKSNFFVSCWHSNEEESMAMWKLYGRVNASVCIETTIERLINCCSEYCKGQQSHNIYLTEVQYVLPDELQGRKPKFLWDYWESANINPSDCRYNMMSIKVLQSLAFKHRAYSYEKEIRLICDTLMGSKTERFTVNNVNGIRMKLSKNFFHKVVLSPEASPVMVDEVKNALVRYGYNNPIIKMSDVNFGSLDEAQKEALEKQPSE